MVQGTTSDAGKSVLVTAICRMLARQNIKVAPFKSQNMALNSAVTPDGGEIGRAQAVQAEACYLQPDVRMNPILLKPNSDLGSQVIVRGKAIGNMKAAEYHYYKPELLKDVVKAHQELHAEFDLVIVEGAGSPAEINLREHDLANMGFAEAVDCPVIIVADIDRGGVFAHLFGTYALLSESEQNRIEGFIINRFRGDPALLQGGLDWLEAKTGKPVLAVIPYLHNLHIEAEDAVAKQQINHQTHQLKVVVPVYPRASNHTDFDALRMHPQVDCQLLRDINEFAGADLIILPGSKNTRGDLAWFKQQGWDKLVQRHLRLGGKVLGICGGYQMLGNWVHDPEGSESTPGSCPGLGHLAIETTLQGEKQLRNVSGHWCGLDANDKQAQAQVRGYEIHVGVTEGPDTQRALVELQDENGKRADGAHNTDSTVMGSYVHGILDQSELLNSILDWAGLHDIEAFDYQAHRANEIDRLADATQQVLPLHKLYKLLDWPVS
ncbi:MAG TPA: cobyric acid synthase CobQ [Oceanospirillaceae bacterium]|nr:cobyric acid synthase CobQ [Oceanospirillaceae bacterium]